MLTAQSIVAAYRAFCERENIPTITPSPVVNEASKTSFNYSLEEPILRKFGTYFNITEKYRFGTIQPCIRTGDFVNIKAGQIDNHLTLFHILPVSYELSPDRNDLPKLQDLAIQRFFRFVCGDLGLDQKRIHVVYFGGGDIRNIAPNLIAPLIIPEDVITRKAFSNTASCVASSDTETFLTSFGEADDFYSGYRFEIYYKRSNGVLVEIGTGESLNYRQIRSDGQTYQILPAEFSISPLAVGLERILYAFNDYHDVFCCDHIAPLVKSTLENSSNCSELESKLLIDSLRAIHMVMADSQCGATLNSSLKGRLRMLTNHFAGLALKVGLGGDVIGLLEMNAAIQPWDVSLNNNFDRIQCWLSDAISRRSKHE